MFREATTAPGGTNQHTEGHDNIITLPAQGTSRAYTLDRLHRSAPMLELGQKIAPPVRADCPLHDHLFFR